MINPIQIDNERLHVDFEDYIQLSSASSVGNMAATLGTGAALSIGTGSNVAIGVANLTSGTTTSSAGVLSSAGAYYLGNGRFASKMSIGMSALSDGSNTYTIRAGLNSATDGTLGVNAVLFEYSSASAAAGGMTAQWRCITSAATVTTTLAAGTAAITLTQLRFVVNSDATRVDFYVNNSFVGYSAANIPASTTALPFVISIVKSAGTTARTLLLDYHRNIYELATPRT